ncbi:hypothetical protein TL16_g06793 [Triparma laevis f. inornata]|uniref:Uncharacterized protein n=1 Tax=Triparma laevis f. inornata TaxID=1714386 RepID=A0A9W7AT54_9STRA|nr:hypothetical protein TL16_g06793 [Triparma laevis f. inornata]
MRKGKSSAQQEKAPKSISSRPASPSLLLTFLLLFIITLYTFPTSSSSTKNDVFFYGWMTCLSTGLGVVPIMLLPNMSSYYLGLSNAVAAGMMTSASWSLCSEVSVNVWVFEWIDFSGIFISNTFEQGWMSDPFPDKLGPEARTLLGVLIGFIFIIITGKFLDKYEHLKVPNKENFKSKVRASDYKFVIFQLVAPLLFFFAISVTNTLAVLSRSSLLSPQKLLLIVFVMTLHSFAEGVGIGVSFGGPHGSTLGKYISVSLAVHNVPEGLAVAIVMLGQDFTLLEIALWCIMTSLPQPVMAVPSYLFIETFLPILPIGLGFAGGAMAYVAVFELALEAYEEVHSWTAVLGVGAISGLCMRMVQEFLHD